MNKNLFLKFIGELKSLRTVIIALVLIGGMLPVTLGGVLFVSLYKTKAMERLIVEVQGQANLLAKDLTTYSYFTDQSSELVNAEIEQLAGIYSLRILLVDGNFNIIKDTYSFEENKFITSQAVITAFRGNNYSNYDKKKGIMEIAIPVYGDDDRTVTGVINLTFTSARINDMTSYLTQLVTVLIIVFFLLELVASVIIARVVVKPLDKLNKSIMKTANGNKADRLELRTLYEYRRISDSVNTMLDKLNALDDSRQEFVSNVSHELKTPMTSMKVLADSLLTQEEVPNELYREFMQDIVGEIDRESQIINDLLTLVKMDQTSAALNITNVNINELIELVLKRLRPIANEKSVELILESFRPVVAEVDEVKLTLAVSNLIENAIKYNNPNGYVRVSLNADYKYLFIKVSDTGIGIPQESIEHVFERFFRVDKARSRGTGGTGLGLAITKSVVLMHKGTIKLYSKENEGSTFTIRIPLYYINSGGDAV